MQPLVHCRFNCHSTLDLHFIKRQPVPTGIYVILTRVCQAETILFYYYKLWPYIEILVVQKNVFDAR